MYYLEQPVELNTNRYLVNINLCGFSFRTFILVEIRNTFLFTGRTAETSELELFGQSISMLEPADAEERIESNPTKRKKR